MNYVGIDWAYGRAAFCAMSETGTIASEGLVPADEDGLAKLILGLGTEVKACVEMMSGAVWVRDQLQAAGWEVQKPKATMFVWAKIPEQFKGMESLEFSKFLIKEAGVAVSPGIGFGEGGEGYMRFALVENEHRIRQAVKGIKAALKKAP